MPLTGKKAFIVDATEGLGRVLVDRFLEKNATVYAHAQDDDEGLNKLVETSGSKVQRVIVDLKDWGGTKEKIESLGPLDYLIISADKCDEEVFLKIDPRHMENLMSYNFHAPLNMSQAFSKKAEGGTIVNISSDGTRKPSKGAGKPSLYAYYCSLAALEMLTKCLAIEFDPKIRVYSLLTGVMRESRLAKTPEHTNFEDAAKVVMYLCSSKSTQASGACITVDEGLKEMKKPLKRTLKISRFLRFWK